jgi:mannose-1-phosphate guanylyltransferase
MLQETVRRVSPGLVPASQIYLITNRSHLSIVHEQCPEVPRENVIGEPMGRDSAPAIGLMARIIADRLCEDAIMAVLPADHVILDPKSFLDTLQKAVCVAEQGYLVTLGVPPTKPETGFGYIQAGAPLTQDHGLPGFSVSHFREKPDKATAEGYIADGGYYWNAGMFVAKVRTFRDLYRKFLPDMEASFEALSKATGTESETEVFDRLFPELTKVSIDYAIAEKCDKVAVVPAIMGWNDVGSWGRLAELFAKLQDGDGNISFAGTVLVNSSRNLIWSQKPVAIVGVDDLVIIDTGDVLLVAHRDSAEEVKNVVARLEAQGANHLL